MPVKTVSGARATTVILDDEVLTVDFKHHYLYFAVRNDGTSNIYISTTNKKAASGEDDVICVPSGTSYVHYNGYGDNSEVYFSGKGTATVIAQDNSENPFKMPAGGAGKSDGYVQNGLLANLGFSHLGESETTQISYAANFLKYTEEMTVECCCMLTGITSNTTQFGRFIDSTTQTLYNFTIGVGLTDNVYTVDYYAGNDNYFPGTADSGLTSNLKNLKPNKIYTIAIRISLTNVDFYCNGDKTAENVYNLNTVIGKSFSPLFIKYSGIVANRNINGYIYSLRFYDRALSDEEIKSNFAADARNFNI